MHWICCRPLVRGLKTEEADRQDSSGYSEQNQCDE